MPPPINSTCPQAMRQVDGQPQFARDAACVEQYLDENCPQAMREVDGQPQFGRDAACVERHTGERPVVAAPAPTPAEEPAPDAEGAEDSDDSASSAFTLDRRWRFSSIYLGANLAQLPPVRQAAANLEPQNGGFAGLSLQTPDGDILALDYGVYHTPFEDRFPAEESIEHRLTLGMRSSYQLFGSPDATFRTQVDHHPSLSLGIRDYDNADTAVSFGVQDFLGAGAAIGDHVSIGLGIFQRSELIGGGENRTPYNLTLGGQIAFNLDRVPTTDDIDPAAMMRLRLFRLSTSMVHSFRVGELQQGIGHIDGLRDGGFDFLVGGLNIPNHFNITLNTAGLAVNGSRTSAGIIAGVGMTGGLVMELAGIFANEPMLVGPGASLFCGSSAGIPTAAGAEDIWANRGVVLGCGALQAVGGLIVFFTAPSPNSGADDPVQFGDPSAPNSDNPHLDISAESRRTSGISMISAGAGSLGASFFILRDENPRSPNRRQPAGAGINLRGQF